MTEEYREALLRAAGVCVATGLAVTSAFYEAGWCAMYLFSVRFPISLVLALVCNPAIVWFATTTTRRTSAGIVPAVAWCVAWFAGTVQTTEGDVIVLSDNWVGIATTILGPLAFAAAIYRVVVGHHGAWPQGQV